MRGHMDVFVAGEPSIVVSLDGRRDVGRRMSAPLRAAYIMSWAIAGLMMAATAMGLFVRGLYRTGPWAREAVRGGDLVTLIVAVPLLVLVLVLSMRGSSRAQAAWIGLLAYSVYNYAFYVFAPKFNDAFLLHIALFSLSVFALAFALPSLDVATLGARLRKARIARWVGGYLVTVGVLQGALWLFVLIRYLVNGELIKDIPVAGQHLVFALDLGLAMPVLIVAGVLLFRRQALGFVLGAAVAVFGAMEQLNLMIGGVFQAHAHVVGIKAFPPESILLTSTFAIAAALLLWGRDRHEVAVPEG